MSEKYQTPYIWMVNHDYLDGKEVMIFGPHGANQNEIEERCTIRFKMYDDDGNLYYSGLMSEECGIEGDPLMDFGTPNAGAVRLDIFNTEIGKWEAYIG